MTRRRLYEVQCTQCDWSFKTERDEVERSVVANHRLNTGHTVRRSREQEK